MIWSFLRINLIFLCGLTSWTAPAKETPLQNSSNRFELIKIRIGSKLLRGSLVDSKSMQRLKELFPFTIKMKDLHGNEKFCELPQALPTSDSNPKFIRAGDIMLYDSSTLVVFYKSFQTSYRYTRLGKIDDLHNLEAVLGLGEVAISFESAD